MPTPLERAEEQLETAIVEEKYIFDCLKTGNIFEAQEVIDAGENS